MTEKKQRIIATDVKEEKLEYFKALAEKMGGKFNAYKEGVGEYTVIVNFD